MWKSITYLHKKGTCLLYQKKTFPFVILICSKYCAKKKKILAFWLNPNEDWIAETNVCCFYFYLNTFKVLSLVNFLKWMDGSEIFFRKVEAHCTQTKKNKKSNNLLYLFYFFLQLTTIQMWFQVNPDHQTNAINCIRPFSLTAVCVGVTHTWT